MAPELVSGSVRVVQPFDAERQDRASDHLPVVGTFLTRD
jgi:endonuclease/exonuclease/phosphatase (EEP) superfamily protein YafD